MIIGSGMGGLLMVELLGTLEVLRFIIFYELDLCYFYLQGSGDIILRRALDNRLWI